MKAIVIILVIGIIFKLAFEVDRIEDEKRNQD